MKADLRPLNASAPVNRFGILAESAATKPPEWCSLVRQYLAGDARAGTRAMSSLSRWRRRYDPTRQEKR